MVIKKTGSDVSVRSIYEKQTNIYIFTFQINIPSEI